MLSLEKEHFHTRLSPSLSWDCHIHNVLFQPDGDIYCPQGKYCKESIVQPVCRLLEGTLPPPLLQPSCLCGKENIFKGLLRKWFTRLSWKSYQDVGSSCGNYTWNSNCSKSLQMNLLQVANFQRCKHEFACPIRKFAHIPGMHFHIWASSMNGYALQYSTV